MVSTIGPGGDKHDKIRQAIFSDNQKEQHQITETLSFGGGAINDTIMHISNPKLPFGGVGQSGIGSYHGEAQPYV